MALISILAQKLGIGSGPKRGATIGGFVIDATLQETHKRSADVTENPVEDGPGITDHINVKAAEITIQGLVSDTPLDVSSSLAGLATTGGALVGKEIGGSLGASAGAIGAGALVGLLKNSDNRVKNGYDHFKDLLAKRVPFTIVTGLEQYENMVISSLEVTRDPRTGQALSFSVDCREIRVIQSAEVTIPKSILGVIHSAGKRAKTGAQSKKELNDSNKTLAAGLFDAALGR